SDLDLARLGRFAYLHSLAGKELIYPDATDFRRFQMSTSQLEALKFDLCAYYKLPDKHIRFVFAETDEDKEQLAGQMSILIQVGQEGENPQYVVLLDAFLKNSANALLAHASREMVLLRLLMDDSFYFDEV